MKLVFQKYSILNYSIFKPRSGKYITIFLLCRRKVGRIGFSNRLC